MPLNTLNELKLLIRSRHGLICLESPEEDRVETLLTHLADDLQLPLFTWSRIRGLRRRDVDKAVYGTVSPSGALAHISGSGFPAVYHFQSLGEDIREPDVVELMRSVAAGLAAKPGVLVVTGDSFQLPLILQRHAAIISLPGPNMAEFRTLLEQILRDISHRLPIKIDITPEDTQRLLNNLKGLTLLEAEKVLTRAIVEDQALTATDIRRIIEAKKHIVEKDGLLEYYPVEATMQDIADLVGLKAWLGKRRKLIEAPERAREYGLEFPKGVLLLGVPGTGKSLCAKAVAMEWGLPLLKMDPASLYNKYVGETEKNFRRSMEVAEKMSPVVLWIDEIEKAFAAVSGEGDGGVSTRVFGLFLSWLQERKGDVFVVATANNVKSLPPELLRKGRFDEIFFVDLPDTEARKTIFSIHLRKREYEPDFFDVDRLAHESQGFSGAEIEQVVVAAIYSAFSSDQPVGTELVCEEIRLTCPLSETMAEEISALREWARDRTVPAN